MNVTVSSLWDSLATRHSPLQLAAQTRARMRRGLLPAVDLRQRVASLHCESRASRAQMVETQRAPSVQARGVALAPGQQSTSVLLRRFRGARVGDSGQEPALNLQIPEIAFRTRSNLQFDCGFRSRDLQIGCLHFFSIPLPTQLARRL